jgi:hypothetical protein
MSDITNKDISECFYNIEEIKQRMKDDPSLIPLLETYFNMGKASLLCDIISIFASVQDVNLLSATIFSMIESIIESDVQIKTIFCALQQTDDFKNRVNAIKDYCNMITMPVSEVTN